MKKKYLVVGLLALALKGKPQAADSTYHKRDLSKTDIELVFSHYNQDGNHSAVTGGTGTEKLQVYAPGFSLDIQKGRATYSLSAGTDIITSASTDRIDSILSSASLVDTRTHAMFNISRQMGSKGIQVGAGTGFSIESDYLSIPARLFMNYAEPSGLRTYQLSAEILSDDLRWGRLNPDYRRPVTLIYPAELRYQEWYDTYMRYSFNLKTGFTQVVNQRLILGIFPEFIYQQGLLATPFHRVYFSDGDLRVENFPGKRFRYPVSLRMHYFAGGITIIKAQYGYYRDNFGITANYIDLESAIRVTPLITISPFVNLYTQTGSEYFEPYSRHDLHSRYYTSDYDLSAFNAIKAGIGFRWAPSHYFTRRFSFRAVSLRYAWYHRGDGLNSHMITTAFAFSGEGRQKP